MPGKLVLDFVGAGPLFNQARDYVLGHRLDTIVRLHGALPHHQVLSLMNEVEVFVQHSVTDAATGDQEGLPVAVLEAMAAGLPVVSTRHAGIPEAVSDGESGYLVDEGDVIGMAERVVTLASDERRRRDLGQAGWMIAAQRFSWDRQRADLLRVLGLSGTADLTRP